MLPAIGDDQVSGVFKYIGCNEALRREDECLDLLIGECRNETEWVYAFDETKLRLEDVPDPSQYMLVKEHIANLFTST